VVIQGSTTDDFKVDRGLKQGGFISTILFIIVLEYVISRLTITPKGSIFNKKTCKLFKRDPGGIETRSEESGTRNKPR
jgi:hypothetical protein